LIRQARRHRKALGGGWRQAGIIAAGALYGIEHHRERLGIDHANALRFANAVAGAGKARVVTPDTNIVMIDLSPPMTAADVARAAAKLGLLVSVWTASRIRVVTHLDATHRDVDDAVRIMRQVLDRG
jgi:threonine aldolase